jgi:hypothetical protein
MSATATFVCIAAVVLAVPEKHSEEDAIMPETQFDFNSAFTSLPAKHSEKDAIMPKTQFDFNSAFTSLPGKHSEEDAILPKTQFTDLKIRQAKGKGKLSKGKKAKFEKHVKKNKGKAAYASAYSSGRHKELFTKSNKEKRIKVEKHVKKNYSSSGKGKGKTPLPYSSSKKGKGKGPLPYSSSKKGKGKGPRSGKPKKPRGGWKKRKFMRAKWRKKIRQRLRFKSLTAAKYTGVIKRNYEIAYGIGLGIYDTTTKAFAAGNSVTSSVSKGGSEELIQEEVPSSSLVDEDAQTGISIEFTAETDNAAAEGNAGALSAASFKEDVEQANAATGASAPIPSESDIGVDKATSSNSGEVVRPTLVALLLVLLVATVHNMQG